MAAYSLKRSGHHCILEWIIRTMGCGVVHHNNAQVKRCRIVSRDIHRYGQAPRENVVSLEEYDLSQGPLRAGTQVIILRDAWNTFASRIKMFKNVVARYREQARRKATELDDPFAWEKYRALWDPLDVGLWKAYAREFLGQTDHLGGAVTVSYNQWFSDEGYRRRLASSFGVYTEEGLDKVSRFGYGSSFDGLAYDGKAGSMDVLSRWRRMEGDPDFEAVRGEGELLDLSEQIFGRY